MHVRIYVNYFGVRCFLFLFCSELGKNEYSVSYPAIFLSMSMECTVYLCMKNNGELFCLFFKRQDFSGKAEFNWPKNNPKI